LQVEGAGDRVVPALRAARGRHRTIGAAQAGFAACPLAGLAFGVAEWVLTFWVDGLLAWGEFGYVTQCGDGLGEPWLRRDWHHLVDLCALVGTLVIDPDGTYDPRLVNDRLLLGLKGTMCEYELSLLRQRGLAARDSKARRGELRFALPPGFYWNEIGHIEMDPDQRLIDTIRLVFHKFREVGSARQVILWLQDTGLQVPVVRRDTTICRIE
jgi:hypothetical protein